MKILQGITGILASKKGTLSLIVLMCATAAVLMSKIDGVSYAAIIGTISTIFMWTTHRTDCEAIKMGIKQ